MFQWAIFLTMIKIGTVVPAYIGLQVHAPINARED